MSTLSPAPSNNTTTPTTSATTPTTSKITPTSSTTNIKLNSPVKPPLSAFHSGGEPPRSQRGLNKPKCSVCGNVARSRCPYLSCKSCCAKAENPCPIHVLKQTGILAEKKPHLPSLFEKSADASPPGTSLRVSSLRQLNQFNGTQTPPRARSQRTRKEAAALNQWRFSKVKEYKERNVEVENEAFERYMQNIGLLEEAFFVHSPDDDDRPAPPAALGRDEIILEFKTRLRSHPRRSHNLKKRIQYIVDHGLSKLRKLDSNDYEVTDLECGKKTERVVAIDELIEKVNKVRNEEELVTCLNMKAQLFSPLEKDEASKEQSSVDAPMPVEPNYMLPRLWSKEEIDQKTLNAIDVHFSSLDQIEDL
ncbi:hypothetical protein ACHQM5_007493 [Ranunculus cassubicifolius]